MNWDHAVSWGRGVWVSVSDIGRVGQPELKQSPQATRGKNNYVAPLIERKIWNKLKKVSYKYVQKNVEAKWVCIIGYVSVFLPL